MAMVTIIILGVCSLVLADERIVRVARISLIEGEVSHQRARDSKKDWYEAAANLPLDESDQLYSGPDGRAEIQLSGRNIVRIDHNTNLRFTQFNTATIQLALAVGTATFRIDSLDRRQFQVVDANDSNMDDPVFFEVDTPVVAITLLREGNYRVNVKDDGTTEVVVRRGQAEVYNTELGTITVKQGRRFVIDGTNNENFQSARIEDKDSWDRWNDRRDDELFSRLGSYTSPRHVPETIPGVYDLDLHGEWIETPDHGWVWSPRGVPADWAPYRHGCWRWYQAYGWTWVSHEPWGWVPYHYGRWVYWRSRWCWLPGTFSGPRWSWSPHLVVFLGWGWGGGGHHGGGGWIGWCPLGPGESYGGRAGGYTHRSIESLRNYGAPGGVSRLEGRRFSQPRVIVENKELTVPPRSVGRRESARPIVVKADDIRPTTSAPSRTPLVDRAEVARKLEAPVFMRRPASEAGEKNEPSRSARRSAGREVRISDGQIIRSDRPAREPAREPARKIENRSVERIDPPQNPLPREERVNPQREATPSQPDNSAPSRSTRPSRSESEPRRIESPPAQPPAQTEERRQPQRSERQPAPQQDHRRHDPQPSRESMPSRNVERPSPPSSPPPSSPPPSPPASPPPSPPPQPPSRESAPERGPDRGMPSRRPGL
jgi:Family of unknown function (DUF6600)/FecR protein